MYFKGYSLIDLFNLNFWSTFQMVTVLSSAEVTEHESQNTTSRNVSFNRDTGKQTDHCKPDLRFLQMENNIYSYS